MPRPPGAGENRSPAPLIRCAVYTRKSTEEGLEQEFNSLMAQREAAEAYVRSQRGQGWVLVSGRYDDGGFSGANMERPALKRLLADVEARRVDCVVVYKVDRLSRSLLDFASIIGMLDRHEVTFVSVTQQFNTNTSLGRLTLNILLSFAQFEREIISERTRDKVFAARRKGKWTGGYPVLGYDIDPGRGRLIVNAAEAKQVRKIFEIFARKGSLTETLYELERHGLKAKTWKTRGGRPHTGLAFTRHTLKFLLSNPIYIGKVRLKGELHSGEHEPLIEAAVWRKVSRILGQRERPRESGPREALDAVLRGLLYCEPCGTPMVPAYTGKRNAKIRYYTCLRAQKHGWKACPSRTLLARRIEEAVLARIGFATPGRSDPGPARRAIETAVERVSYDGATGQVRITVRAWNEQPS